LQDEFTVLALDQI